MLGKNPIYDVSINIIFYNPRNKKNDTCTDINIKVMSGLMSCLVVKRWSML